MKQIIEIERKNELLERKEVLEEALEILEAEAADDHYLMISDTCTPCEECLNYGWYELLTFEEVEALEVDKGEDVWEVYEDYLISALDMKYILEDEVREIEGELYHLKSIIEKKQELVVREFILEKLLFEEFWFEGDYIFFVGELEELEYRMFNQEFSFLLEDELKEMIEEAGGEDLFYEEYGDILIGVYEAKDLFEKKLEEIKRKTNTFKYVKGTECTDPDRYYYY